MISDEASIQVQKLTESVVNFSEKLNFYKQRENVLLQEIANLEYIIKQHKEYNKKLNMGEDDIKNQNQNSFETVIENI